MRDLILEIWESLRRNKLRTTLTGFAVSWGIFMLIVLLGFGNGLMNSFNQDRDSFASNSIMLFSGNTTKAYAGYEQGRWVPLKYGDMSLLKKEFKDNIEDVTTNISQGGFTMTYGKHYITSVSLNGTFPSDARMNKVKMVAGRFINENDIAQERKVLVLSHLHARSFLGGSTDYEKMVGRKVKLGDIMFTVIGVKKTEENNNNRDVQIPYTTLKKLFAISDIVHNITFTFHGINTIEENEMFEKEIRETLNRAHFAAPDDPGTVHFWNRLTQNIQMDKASGILQLSLWIVGLFTLLSGIVGVGNIMLITVKERTHEFGIRKAIGATPWQVMNLIIMESITVTIAFGYVGMILGLVSCEILDATVGSQSMSVFGEQIKMLDDPTVGVGTAIGATLVLVIAGTIAGIIPARKASKVKPIEALQAC